MSLDLEIKEICGQVSNEGNNKMSFPHQTDKKKTNPRYQKVQRSGTHLHHYNIYLKQEKRNYVFIIKKIIT